MDFKSYLNETAGSLDKEIQSILVSWEKEVVKLSPKLTSLAKAFIKACSSGKRIRGTLMILGHEIASSSFDKLRTPRNDVVRVGAAYEIVHTALLAHDDIIDKSPTRRGQPSLYKSIGISKALTLGDLGFFLAVKIISESNFPEKEKNEALTLFAKTMVDTATGQILDIAHADPELVAKLKTAQYTICGPLFLGAILGGLGPTSPRLRGVKEFGENLGIAYQIRDDILDGEALDNARHLGVKYTKAAKSVIPKITKDQKMQRLLTEMADFLIERKF